MINLLFAVNMLKDVQRKLDDNSLSEIAADGSNGSKTSEPLSSGDVEGKQDLWTPIPVRNLSYHTFMRLRNYLQWCQIAWNDVLRMELA